jgi:type IV secretion system protein VirB11
VVSGATGSGKTTFMKSLVNHIPADERLVTIEDARELFIRQPNVVHLLYSKGGQSASNVTAKSCMEACLRMKPDRIILAELRGDEVVLLHPQLRLRPSRLESPAATPAAPPRRGTSLA